MAALGVAPASARSQLVCTGCGASPPPRDPSPFRCPSADSSGDVDHVLSKQFAWREVGTPAFWQEVFRRAESNPFLKFRELLHVYHAALDLGVTDAEWVDVVTQLDAAVARVEGRGFHETPFARMDELSRQLQMDGMFVKDETGNVAASHKGRHLFGVLVWLEVARREGLLPKDAPPRLAIASCGNAALAAAVLARAVSWPLQVFVPEHADASVVARLRELGADIVPCPRAGDVPGDPCVHRFHEAVRAGAIPFSCQGNENGLVIDGGETLGYEIASSLLQQGLSLDRMFIQVGGGALASATVQALRRCHDIGVLKRIPRVHTVQTEGGYPLGRAWERFLERNPGALVRASLDEAIAFAARHRAMFMQPWPTEPRSLASGILDDETYDWLELVRAMAETDGGTIVVPERTVARARDLARETTSIAVDATGTAGLAGCLAHAEAGNASGSERVAVLFTGAERSPAV